MDVEEKLAGLSDALPPVGRFGRPTVREICLTRYSDGTWMVLAGGHPSCHIGEYGGDYQGGGVTIAAAIDVCLQSIRRNAS